MLLAATPTPALAIEKRVALVIGNNDYQHVEKLRKAVNDAHAVARELEKIGFEVISVTNANRRTMNSSINNLVEKVSGGGVAVFFFAGHGLQIQNQNFLVPVDMDIPTSTHDVGDQTISLQGVQDKLADAKAKFALLVIDACRDNPLPMHATRSMRLTRGLAPPVAPNGQIVLFSAGAHQQAMDALSDQDNNPNGLFTREFLPMISTPGISAVEALRRVKTSVTQQAKSVGHDQQPALYEQTDGEFYFLPGAAMPAAMQGSIPKPSSPVARVDSSVVELEYWKSAQQTGTAESYRSYLNKYPKGQYGELAVANLNKLTDQGREPPNRSGTGDGSTIELALWGSVADSGDISEYEEYLRQYPNGRFAVIAKNRIRTLSAKSITSSNAKPRTNKNSEAISNLYSKTMQGDTSAFAQLRRIAEQGNADAQTKLGFMYEYGRAGLPKDKNVAAAWYRRAAEQGFARAQAGIGSMYLNGTGGFKKDEQLALKWLRKAADQGDDRGQNAVGRMYQKGLGGLPKDDVMAVKWYRKAAEQDSSFGQNSLANMYADGLGGLPRDDLEAAKLYRRAAEQGSAPAQYSLGQMYASGRGGLKKDDAEALKWYRSAAEQGNRRAEASIGLMYMDGRAGLVKDDSEAVKWFRLAAEKNSDVGQVNLGLMYEQGRGGLPKDDVEAVAWYRKAADQNNLSAQKSLAAMYAQARGPMPKDDAEARNLADKTDENRNFAEHPQKIGARPLRQKTVDQIYAEIEGKECKGQGIRFLCQGNLKTKLCREYKAFGKPGSTICPVRDPAQETPG